MKIVMQSIMINMMENTYKNIVTINIRPKMNMARYAGIWISFAIITALARDRLSHPFEILTAKATTVMMTDNTVIPSKTGSSSSPLPWNTVSKIGDLLNSR